MTVFFSAYPFGNAVLSVFTRPPETLTVFFSNALILLGPMVEAIAPKRPIIGRCAGQIAIPRAAGRQRPFLDQIASRRAYVDLSQLDSWCNPANSMAILPVQFPLGQEAHGSRLRG